MVENFSGLSKQAEKQADIKIVTNNLPYPNPT